MSSTAIEASGKSAKGAAPARLKLLFFLHSIHYNRVFESLLRAMLARGHEVLVALDHQKGRLGQTHLFGELSEQYPAFGYEEVPARNDLWLIPATAIRRRLDYLRSLEPEHTDASPFGDRPPLALRALLFLPPFRWQFGRRLIALVLRRLEAGMPIPRSVRSFIEDQAPDVVLVSPLVEFGSAQGDYVRTAERAQIPTVLVVASGDDLTSKSAIRDVPTLTVAWNETQVDEAVRLHGVPPERIVAIDFVPRGGLEAPAAPGAVEAIERAAPTEVAARREGRFLRPLLWLLTPLLAIVLPLLRPRATGRAVVKAGRRLTKRISKRGRELRRGMSRRKARRATHRAQRRDARARASREKKKLKAREAREKEKLKARETKQREKAKAHAAKEEERAKAHAAKEEEKLKARAAKEQEKARARAAEE